METVINRNAAKCVLEGVRATFDGWNASIIEGRELIDQCNAIADYEGHPDSEEAKITAQELRLEVAHDTDRLRKCVAKAFELEQLLEDATSTDEAIGQCAKELILGQ